MTLPSILCLKNIIFAWFKENPDDLSGEKIYI